MKSFRLALIIPVLLGFLAVDAADAQRERKRRGAEPQPQESAAGEAGTATATAPQSLASSLGLFVFPAADQTPEQQAADEAECSSWAETQVSQAATAAPAASPPPAPPAGKDRSALKGAAAGAVVGELLEDDEPEPLRGNLSAGDVRDDYSAPKSRDDVGDNAEDIRESASSASRGDVAKKLEEEDDGPSDAAKGAAAGAVVGHRKAKKGQAQATAQADAAAKQAADEATAAQAESLKKALSVCLEAKGYTVK